MIQKYSLTLLAAFMTLAPSLTYAEGGSNIGGQDDNISINVNLTGNWKSDSLAILTEANKLAEEAREQDSVLAAAIYLKGLKEALKLETTAEIRNSSSFQALQNQLDLVEKLNLETDQPEKAISVINLTSAIYLSASMLEGSGLNQSKWFMQNFTIQLQNGSQIFARYSNRVYFLVLTSLVKNLRTQLQAKSKLNTFEETTLQKIENIANSSLISSTNLKSDQAGKNVQETFELLGTLEASLE